MNKFIKVGKELVPVSEEVYKEYYKMARREKYITNDIKLGHFEVNSEDSTSTYIPSKEDSLERLIELGSDFADGKSVEDVICDKAIMVVLQEAMAELNFDEQELIQAIYYKNLTTRQIAEQEKVHQTTIVKRHKKVLEKIKKYFL